MCVLASSKAWHVASAIASATPACTAAANASLAGSNAAVATALLLGVTLLDVVAYAGVKVAHRRAPDSNRDYSDRTGLPRGAQASRGLARQDFEIPPDLRAEARVAQAIPMEVA